VAEVAAAANEDAACSGGTCRLLHPARLSIAVAVVVRAAAVALGDAAEPQPWLRAPLDEGRLLGGHPAGDVLASAMLALALPQWVRPSLAAND